MEIQWLETFKLGVPEIDNDHFTLFELMQSVEEAAQRAEQIHFEKSLDRLLSFAKSHFKRENFLLKQWRFPDVEAHILYHTELIRHAEDMKQSCLQALGGSSLPECCNSLMSFLIDDVIRDDMKFKSFLEYEGLILHGRGGAAKAPPRV